MPGADNEDKHKVHLQDDSVEVNEEVVGDDVPEVENDDAGKDSEGGHGHGVSATIKAAPSKRINKAQKRKAEEDDNDDNDDKGEEKKKKKKTANSKPVKKGGRGKSSK